MNPEKLAKVIDLVITCEDDRVYAHTLLMDLLANHPDVVLDAHDNIENPNQAYDMVLTGYIENRKIPAIKAIRSLTGYGLAYTKHLVENDEPPVLLRSVTKQWGMDQLRLSDPEGLLHVDFVPVDSKEFRPVTKTTMFRSS